MTSGGVDRVLEVMIEHLDERIQNHSIRVDRSIGDHDMRLRLLEDFRARAIGMLLIVSALGSLIGALATSAIIKFMHL